MASRASSGGVSASSTPTASSPQDDTVDGDDISWASSHVPSLAPDSPIARPHNIIEIQVGPYLQNEELQNTTYMIKYGSESSL